MDERAVFEWDPAKADANLAKHGLPFDEAIAVFADPARIEFDVSHPGDGELRLKTVGIVDGRLISVVYTLRTGAFRIISARRANNLEIRRHGDRQV